MSECYGLACASCREYVWIAQEGVSRFTFYSGDPATMEVLRRFLYTHMGQEHPLVCEMTQLLDYAEIAAEDNGQITRREYYVDEDERAKVIGHIDDGEERLPVEGDDGGDGRESEGDEVNEHALPPVTPLHDPACPRCGAALEWLPCEFCNWPWGTGPRIARGSGKTVTQTSILAEISRLRQALATIAEMNMCVEDDCDQPLHVAARTAREVLEEKK